MEVAIWMLIVTLLFVAWLQKPDEVTVIALYALMLAGIIASVVISIAVFLLLLAFAAVGSIIGWPFVAIVAMCEKYDRWRRDRLRRRVDARVREIMAATQRRDGGKI